jgi:hypothetical protein
MYFCLVPFCLVVPDIPGGSGNFRECPGISGNFREDFRGLLYYWIHYSFRECPGISGNFRELPGMYYSSLLTVDL